MHTDPKTIQAFCEFIKDDGKRLARNVSTFKDYLYWIKDHNPARRMRIQYNVEYAIGEWIGHFNKQSEDKVYIEDKYELANKFINTLRSL